MTDKSDEAAQSAGKSLPAKQQENSTAEQTQRNEGEKRKARSGRRGRDNKKAIKKRGNSGAENLEG